jgi:hypothetical protein
MWRCVLILFLILDPPRDKRSNRRTPRRRAQKGGRARPRAKPGAASAATLGPVNESMLDEGSTPAHARAAAGSSSKDESTAAANQLVGSARLDEGRLAPSAVAIATTGSPSGGPEDR